MDDSIAHPGLGAPPLDLPAWKSAIATICGGLVALLFIVAGTWKITDPLTASTLMTQALVPGAFALPLALTLGISETFGGVLLLVPRYRRWGAAIVVLLLIAFMGYIGINYDQLHGKECNCFPWIKRAVGPMFFVSDALMLAGAAIAGWWSQRSFGLRNAGIILGAVGVFAATSYGITIARQSGIKAPDSITVAGQPYSLQQGRIFVYFFDPECSHCDAAARRMAKFQWREVTVVGVPVAQPRFGPEFMTSTGLKGALSNDYAKLKETFHFPNAPYAVMLVNGRQKAAFSIFDDSEPAAELKKLGFIE